jgi:hypothetical protein
MGEDELPEPKYPAYSSDMRDHYDTMRGALRELTLENLKSAGNLIDISMRLVSAKKVDAKTGFRTAYVTTRKILGGKSDLHENRFYVMIRDLKAKDEVPDLTKGLAVRYIKTRPNLEPISQGLYTLPRDTRFAEDQYLESLKSKDQDWEIVEELAQDLKTNYEVYRSRMYIEEDQYETVNHVR